MNSEVRYEDTYNWLSQLVRKPRKTTHPLRHILFIHFLGLSCEQFFGGLNPYHPFGTGPWPCLNAAAEHFRQPVITDCVVTKDSKVKVPIGTFSCECGFVYSRRGPDKGDSDRYRIGRIKEFGELWKQELIKIAKEGEMGLRETARRLHVDPGTVKNQLQKIREEEKKRRREWVFSTEIYSLVILSSANNQSPSFHLVNNDEGKSRIDENGTAIQGVGYVYLVVSL